MRKITYTMLCRPCWNNIALEYCLVNVAQIRLTGLGQRCTKNYLRNDGSKRRYTFAGKPAVSNKSGSLLLTGYLGTRSLNSLGLFFFYSVLA